MVTSIIIWCNMMVYDGNKHISYNMFHFPLTFQLGCLCLQNRWKQSTSMDIPQFYAKTCQILLFIMACLIIIEFSKMTFQSHKLLLVSWLFCGGYLLKKKNGNNFWTFYSYFTVAPTIKKTCPCWTKNKKNSIPLHTSVLLYKRCIQFMDLFS